MPNSPQTAARRRGSRSSSPEGWTPVAPELPPTPAPHVAGYGCAECFDTGVFFPDGARVAKECPCGAFLAGHVATWSRDSGIPRRHCANGGFDSYRAKSRHHGTVRDHCRKYADEFFPGASGMILAGPVGGGKTHLACAIAWHVLHRRRPDGSGFCSARFWSTPQLLAEIRATYRAEAEEHESDIAERATGADLLVLDDFGAEKATDHAADRLFLILNGRLEAGRTTIVTTNLNPDGARAAAHFGDRIFSRLGEIAKPENVLQLNFNDHRRGPKT